MLRRDSSVKNAESAAQSSAGGSEAGDLTKRRAEEPGPGSSVGWGAILYTKRLWVRSQVGARTGGSQLTSLSLSLLSLKSVNIFLGEDWKEQRENTSDKRTEASLRL